MILTSAFLFDTPKLSSTKPPTSEWIRAIPIYMWGTDRNKTKNMGQQSYLLHRFLWKETYITGFGEKENEESHSRDHEFHNTMVCVFYSKSLCIH